MNEDFMMAFMIVALIAALFGGTAWTITTHKKCKRDVVSICLSTGHQPKECFSY